MILAILDLRGNKVHARRSKAPSAASRTGTALRRSRFWHHHAGVAESITQITQKSDANAWYPPIVAIHGRNQTSPWDQTERLEGRLI
jgi:hypothetical protein